MKLYLMQLAALQPDSIPVPAHLIAIGERRNILVDAGFPASFAKQQIGLPGGITVKMSEDDFIVNRLGSLGLNTENKDFVVCTHLDTYHALNWLLFETKFSYPNREGFRKSKCSLKF